MKLARSSSLAAATVAAMVVGVEAAYAQAAPDYIIVRQGVMRSFNAHMQLVGAVGRGEINNAMLAQAAATAINTISKQLPALFPNGSGAETGQRTRAKPEIWAQNAAFKAAAAKLDEESAKLLTAAQSGNAQQIAAAATAVTNNACNACHGAFRAAAQ